MNRQDAAADRLLSLTFKIGAYTSCVLIMAGMILQHVAAWGSSVAKTGLLVLLLTPAIRIIVACIQFFRERDTRYGLVSLGVLGIVVLAYFLGIQA